MLYSIIHTSDHICKIVSLQGPELGEAFPSTHEKGHEESHRTHGAKKRGPSLKDVGMGQNMEPLTPCSLNFQGGQG